MSALLARLESSRQRQLVALQGPQSWCDEQCKKLFEVDASMQLVSNREPGATAIPFSKADACLGGEAGLDLSRRDEAKIVIDQVFVHVVGHDPDMGMAH